MSTLPMWNEATDPTFVLGKVLKCKKPANAKMGRVHQAATSSFQARELAHEFNNLLMVIRSYAELLQESLEGNANLAAHVDSILSASERGAALTRQVLAGSRKGKIPAEVVDLSASVLESRFVAETFGKKIKAMFIAGGVLPIAIDPDQLFQVIANLCINARDAMPDGGILAVSTRGQKVRGHVEIPDGNYAVLEVSDTGVGFSEEVAAQIFQPFFTTKEHGAGLGLAIINDIVRSNGGYFTVDSVAGAGTTFEVFFPEISHSRFGSRENECEQE